MRYIKIEFTSGLSGFAWQEISDANTLVCYRDENGVEMNLLNDNGDSLIYEAKVVEDDAVPPFEVVLPEQNVAEVVAVNIMPDEPPVEELPTTVEELDAKIRSIIAESR